MNHPEELARLRSEYSRREERLASSDRYSSFNPAYLYAIHQRQAATFHALRKAGIRNLKDQKILEIGCGSGRVLLEYLAAEAQQCNIFGIDIQQKPLSAAQKRLPDASFACCNGEYLPFPTAHFDLVLQYTAFSSVLEDAIRINMAKEALRVLKPGGIIVWYDFWTNPLNKQTHGIRAAEIRSLFPNCEHHIRKITLAPPITRRLVPRFTLVAYILEALSIFNSHLLATIRQKNSRT
ncbi:MAG TPA: class I SAM-dependent methyltransferase [Anaerolineaceae bacterium]